MIDILWFWHASNKRWTNNRKKLYFAAGSNKVSFLKNLHSGQFDIFSYWERIEICLGCFVYVRKCSENLLTEMTRKVVKAILTKY